MIGNPDLNQLVREEALLSAGRLDTDLLDRVEDVLKTFEAPLTMAPYNGPLQWHSVAVDVLAYTGFEPTVARDVDFAPKHLFKLEHQACMVEQTGRWLPVDEQIDIAVRAVFAACGGADQAQVRSPVPRRGRGDKLTICEDQVSRGHSMF